VGITPKITFEGEEADTVAGLVAAGLGVSILPNLKGTDQSNVSQIRVSWPQLTAPLVTSFSYSTRQFSLIR
jgi:hypothetical protein